MVELVEQPGKGMDLVHATRPELVHGVERALDDQMLVIADAENAEDIGGVMGGANSEITAATTRVVFEAAYFAPAQTEVEIGRFVILQRNRTCNATTGCGGWVTPAGVELAYSAWDMWSPGPGSCRRCSRPC